MAERRAVPPPVPAPPEPASSPTVSTAFGSPLEPVAALPPPPAHDTYVVKVQKDQIYRVPPPENAYLAERYRSERAAGGGGSKQRSASCTPCVLRTVGALVVTAALVGAAIAICVVVLRPDLPSFSVDGLSVSVHTAAGQPRRVDYDLFLTAVNPNKMTALWYKDGGTARLRHQGTVIAKGTVGEPADGGQDATDFSLVLHGVQQHGGHAPRTVEKGLAGSKDALPLQLTVEATVQVHIGALGFGQRRLAVECEFSAAGLRKEVRISSQKCNSVFRN